MIWSSIRRGWASKPAPNSSSKRCSARRRGQRPMGLLAPLREDRRTGLKRGRHVRAEQENTHERDHDHAAGAARDSAADSTPTGCSLGATPAHFPPVTAVACGNEPGACGFAQSARFATARPWPMSAFARQKSTIFPGRIAPSQPTAFLRHRLCLRAAEGPPGKKPFGVRQGTV